MSRLTKNKLLARMILTLLPASALPLFIFGYFAISSHFASLHEESLANHRDLTSFMRSQLEGDVSRVLSQLKKAAENEVLRTKNQFQIREALASFRAFNTDLVAVYVLGPDGTVQAADPPAPAVEGKGLSGLELDEFEDDQDVSPLFVDDTGAPRFFAARELRLAGGKVGGYIVAETSLASWMSISRAILRNQKDMLAALLPNDSSRGVPISISADATGEAWKKIAALRLRGETGAEVEIGNEVHHLSFQTLESLALRLVVAQPLSSIYAAPRFVVLTYAGVIAGLFLVLSALIVVVARSITIPISEVATAATSFAEGQLEVRAPVQGSDETMILAKAFNEMGDKIQASQRRMKIMYKAIMELFACNDLDLMMKKSVELACTQCGADAAWFVPSQHGREVLYDRAAVFVGLHGWLWKDHRASEITAREATGVWTQRDGERVYPFSLKDKTRELGLLRVAYGKNPDDATVALLQSLVTLVETALVKQEMIVQGAMVSTELEIAEVVQRNIMAENMLLDRAENVAFHYQPASRLGGDWFYLIEDKVNDRLHVIMGDVTGHGLAQGLITTAVKGALDVLEILLSNGSGVIDGPASIVSFLDRVVARVAKKSKLTMTCLAARIDFRTGELHLCNAGHTFPILVPADAGAKTTKHLHKNQQPMLGLAEEMGRSNPFEAATYQLDPGDFLVVYTDGLSEAKNLKSEIFGRFLFRSLKQPRAFPSSRQMKDEILRMFQFYTQSVPLEDDVCFLVVQIPAACSLPRDEIEEKAVV